MRFDKNIWDRVGTNIETYKVEKDEKDREADKPRVAPSIRLAPDNK